MSKIIHAAMSINAGDTDSRNTPFAVNGLEGAIFDMDGTLLDSMSMWSTMGERYLRSIGYEPRPGLNDAFRALSLYQATCYYQREYGVTLSSEELLQGINTMVEQYYTAEAVLKPGVAEFLEQLHQKGVKMCVATATDHYLVETGLKRCGIDKYFSQIFTCGIVGHGKDEPIIFREALRHLGTNKSKTLVFEDALHALTTAKEDGFPVVAVYDAQEKHRDKMLAMADLYINSFEDTEQFWKFAAAL